MIVLLDHVQLAIPPNRDEDARRYYGGVLKLREIQKPDQLRSRGGVWFSFPDGRQLHLGIEDDFRPSKKAHPCFVVDDGFDELAHTLTQAGFVVTFDELNPPARRFYTHDVFGNRLEFADRASQRPLP